MSVDGTFTFEGEEYGYVYSEVTDGEFSLEIRKKGVSVDDLDVEDTWRTIQFLIVEREEDVELGDEDFRKLSKQWLEEEKDN